MKITVILLVGYLVVSMINGVDTLESKQNQNQADRVALIDAAFNQ